MFLGSNIALSLAYEWGKENEYARMAHLLGALTLLTSTVDQIGAFLGIDLQDISLSVVLLLLDCLRGVFTKPLHILNM